MSDIEKIKDLLITAMKEAEIIRQFLSTEIIRQRVVPLYTALHCSTPKECFNFSFSFSYSRAAATQQKSFLCAWHAACCNFRWYEANVA